MGNIHAPFAARDYDSGTHIKDVIEVSPVEVPKILAERIGRAAAGYIEPISDGKTRITTITERQ